MKISLRTSGGRGEFELTGNHGPIRHWDLKGRQLRYVFGFGVEIPGLCHLTDQGGKPRLRLEPKSGAQHLYQIAAAILLMPPPFRELSKTTARDNFWDGSFSVTSIGVRVMNRELGIINIESIEIRSHAGLHTSFDVLERLASVEALWNWAQSATTLLAEALRLQWQAITISPSDHKGILTSTARVLRFAQSGCDPLDSLCAQAGVARFRVIETEFEELFVSEVPEEDEEDPNFSVTRLIRKSRLVLDRGHAGAKFRREVREAYQDRCLATGVVLRGCSRAWRSGGEAAHIHPFCKGGVNSVSNGILLSPTAHWAFDQGFLRLNFNPKSGFYEWAWDSPIYEKAKLIGCELNRLNFAIGSIDPDWLPKEPSRRPKPSYLRVLSELLEGNR